jgi:hypothetical protein
MELPDLLDDKLCQRPKAGANLDHDVGFLKLGTSHNTASHSILRQKMLTKAFTRPTAMQPEESLWS